MMRNALLWASRSRRLQNFLPRFPPTRRAVMRFMPGEEVGAALDAAEAFRVNGIATVLTRLGENFSDAREAERVVEHYVEVLGDVSRRGIDCHVSVKLTQLGLDLDRALALQHLRTLVGAAGALNNMIWVDMEGSSYVDATIDVFRSVREQHANVGLCLQAYLHRTPRDLESLLPLAPAIRLVKGAYAEPPSSAISSRREVDGAYMRLAETLLKARLQSAAQVALATHDTSLIRAIRIRARSLGLQDSAVEFQMLYGIQRDEQLRLARERCPVRVLISYGDAWYPWFMRRLAERPANLLFVAKNLLS